MGCVRSNWKPPVADRGTMQIFLGSSREASASGMLRRIAVWIEACGHTPVRWDDPGVFPPGTYTFQVLQRLAKTVDAAIFIFSDDDKVWYRTENTTQPRDNILLEYGLFSAALGEERVAICRSGNPRMAADLLGITYINITENRVARAEDEIVKWLTRIAGLESDRRIADPEPESTSAANIVMEHLDSPFQASGKRSLFLKGTELVRRARNRVALVAKTPIILMGPRPYDGSGPPRSYEKQQYDAYMNLIKVSSQGSAPDFICVASRPCVLADLEAYSHTPLLRQARSRYIDIDQRSVNASARSRMTFGWHADAAPMTFLVSDDSFMIWFKDGSGESVWITAVDEVVSDALWSNAQTISGTLTAGEVLRDFDNLLPGPE